MKIALDIMSGDNAPLCNIKGAIQYIESTKSANNTVHLYGTEKIYQNNKKLIDKNKNRIKYVITQNIVEMHEKPSVVFKKKRNSSLIKIIDDLKLNKVHAAVSSGNTGALLTASLLILGKISGIRRPALAPYIPIKNSGFILADAGANTSVKPDDLLQFALMSSSYMKIIKNIKSPKIALLNIGSEENKGNDFTIESYSLLKNNLDNFIGNIESRDLFTNKADIILCDGFTGNIVLKLIEGLIDRMIKRTLESINDHSMSSLLKPILTPFYNDIKKSYDYEEHGGTIFLGVNGIVMKCHGSSNDKAIYNGLLNTQKALEINLITEIENSLNLKTSKI